MGRFGGVYKETAALFDWQKREEHQVSLSEHYADLRHEGHANES